MKRDIFKASILVAMLVSAMLTGCGSEKEEDVETAQETPEVVEVAPEGEVEPITEVTNEDELYTIWGVPKEVDEFFDLWMSAQASSVLNNNGRITDMTTLLEHDEVIGHISVNQKLHVVEDYEDINFKGLEAETSGIKKAVRDTSQVKTNVDIIKVLSNTNDNRFSYYAGTNAVLSYVVQLSCYVDGKQVPMSVFGDKNKYVAITLVNNANNPEEWLLSGVYDLRATEEITKEYIDQNLVSLWNDYGSYAKENGFDIMADLVSEDITKISSTGADDYLKAYAMELGERYNDASNFMIKLGNSEIPYLFSTGYGLYGINVLHYENGEVIENKYMLNWDLYMSEYKFGDIVLLDNGQMAIYIWCAVDDGSPNIYGLCSIKDGVIESENGEIVFKEITQGEFDKYKNEGISIFDVVSHGNTVEDANQNMISIK